jgi:hypothetical protein
MSKNIKFCREVKQIVFKKDGKEIVFSKKGIPGNPGRDGTDGTDGTDGEDGVGVPSGGLEGQVLTKIDEQNYNTEWRTPEQNLTWIDVLGSAEFTKVKTLTDTGVVFTYLYQGQNIYRYIDNTKNSFGYPLEDSFYRNFNFPNLSDLIVTRNSVRPPEQPIFEFIIKTDNVGTSNDDQFILPLISSGNYDFNIDWGDGSSDTITTFDDPALTHTYSIAGTYTILITGNLFEYIYFNNSGDRLKMLEILRFDLLSYGLSGANSFLGCENLVFSSTRSPQTGSATNLSRAFENTQLSSLPENIDFSNVTNLQQAFENTQLTSLPENIDFSSVTNLNKVFFNTPLSSLPDNIDFSSVENLERAFVNTFLSSLPVNINFSNVTNLNRAFVNTQLLSLPDNIDFSSVTNLQFAFFNTPLSSLPENIDFSSVTDFTSAFQNCNLNSQGIDVFLAACVANGRSNLDTNLSGGNNLGFSSWSAQALSDYNTLILDGWTITTNP